MLPRPGGDGTPEEADEVAAVYHQSRKRTRHEGGEVVVEDQDLVFTERRVTWPAGSVPFDPEAGAVEAGDVKAEVDVSVGERK